jgi:PKD repeat protein
MNSKHRNVKNHTFEHWLSNKLVNATSDVPPGMWEGIAARLSAPQPAPAKGMAGAFGAGAAAAGVLLISLATFSSLREPATATYYSQAAVPAAATPVTQEQQVAEAASYTATATEGVAEPMTPATDAQQGQAAVLGQSIRAKASETQSTQRTQEQLATTARPGTDKTNSPAATHPAQAAESVQHTAAKDGETYKPADKKSNQPLKAKIKASATKGYTPFTVQFENEGWSESVLWDFGIKGKSQQAKPSLTYSEPGTYTVYLTAEDAEGHLKTDYLTIEVKEGSKLFAPDSFTPNGDGINDTYRVEGLHLESFHLMVVNSKGKTLFETRDPKGEWVFEPTVHGGDGEVYIAVIRARGIDGVDYNLTRRLNIIY